MNKNLTIYCDGGSRGNPGPAAGAFAVFNKTEKIYEKSKFIGVATNNVAEYTAVVMALEWLALNQQDIELVTFVLDSQLVTNQLTGKYKIKNVGLLNLAAKAKDLERKLKPEIVYTWSPRDKNTTADFLVNVELDKQS